MKVGEIVKVHVYVDTRKYLGLPLGITAISIY